MTIRRALLSVTDRTGLAELADFLAARGVELIASGGTRRHLAAAGVETVELADWTGSPECLDGRVKTLHPKVFGGILADPARHAADLALLDLPLIDLVVVNLYRFRETAAAGGPAGAVVEAIDIGGPSLLRAAAKNHARVAVLCRVADYAAFMAAFDAGGGDVGEAMRRRLAAAAFAHTRDYDTAVAAWAAARAEAAADAPGAPAAGAAVGGIALGEPLMTLRYGENPHQGGALHPWLTDRLPFRQLGGAELSYNNLTDLGAALDLVLDLDGPAAAVIKHGNPCGVGFGADIGAALAAAWSSDPVSAYGSVIALSHPADEAVAAALAKKFVEVLVAPGYLPAARERLLGKKKLRLLELPDPRAWLAPARLRSVGPLLLVQDADRGFAPPAAWTHGAGPEPDAAVLAELERAWRVVKHVKSNAVLLWRADRLLGAGAGQTSRVDSCRIAVAKARELGHETAGAVAASDAFFPFPDGIEILAAAGARAVVQPGGSIRDAEVLARAGELGVTVMLTGRRHFRH
ncbi:MAG: bifunctional phosphoribosylaminoimidazolecarboxamide formyltransferase/IMP cyclohydrolase [Candidatus Krumholzibacteriota bacterium]|nr:bifunctional phosphoribosylaminoimidazolecarboxamide formyltransferase/IMP cyclohydrolase [Candidatus Krumholzibacteriota bacterium]